MKIFLNLVIGILCVLMMSCSTKVLSDNSKGSLESNIIDNLDGTLTLADNQNNLQWPKDDLTPGPYICYGGGEKSLWYLELYIECLNKHKYLGYNDWRIPTYKELESLLATSEIKNSIILSPQVYERLKEHAYWSTVDIVLFIHRRGIMIYNVIGPIYSYHQLSSYYVWPVRSDNKLQMVASGS